MTESLYDRVQRLRQEAGDGQRDYPESWFPTKPGEDIGGEFVRYAEARRKDGSPATVAHLRTPDGDRTIWLTHAVLADQLSDLAEGEAVYIRFEGKRRSASGFDYNDYTVAREGGGQPSDEVPF